MTQEISMKIIFPSCVLNCQFRMYVNLSACTTVISGWVVVVSSFRDGRCVCVHACAHMCVSILSAHQCFWGFLLGAEDCRLWYHHSFWSDSHLPSSVLQFTFSALSLTFLQILSSWCLVSFDFSPSSLAMLQEFFSPCFSCCCCSLAQ